ncbi:hypothetical protein ACYULU_11915 [Breznakiellaceae bacterium SP9]
MKKQSIDFLDGWYKSSERAGHPHPRKYKVVCSLDEDVIRWLQEKTDEYEEYTIEYINYYLRKVMARDHQMN